jgi:hypothetical protein
MTAASDAPEALGPSSGIISVLLLLGRAAPPPLTPTLAGEAPPPEEKACRGGDSGCTSSCRREGDRGSPAGPPAALALDPALAMARPAVGLGRVEESAEL